MNRKIICNYTDACPHTGKEQSIRIDYVEYPSIGSSGYSYKKTGFSCPHRYECPFPEKDNYQRCPLLIKAPDAPH